LTPLGMILSTGRNTTSRNASATLAFHQARSAREDVDDGDLVQDFKLGVERVDQKFQSRLIATLSKPKVKEVSVLGPKRESRPEAIRDGIELGRVFAVEGEIGAKRIALRLERKKWSPKDIETADESELENFALPSSQSGQASGQSTGSQKLIPPGEGWVRHDELMLVNPQSQVYFVQIGKRSGQYLKRDPKKEKWEEVDVPHPSQEYPISLRAASASCVRKGGKLDRAVLLNDITKIARLALKFPLSFVDLPACAYALFQGHRSAESSQWCAENFHKKLLPLVAEQIHAYETRGLQHVLRKTLEALDAEILKSSHAFSGCSALIALVLGDRCVVAGVGHVRAVLLPAKGPLRPILSCTGDPSSPAECERIQKARGIVQSATVLSTADGLSDACRILSARHTFDVLQMEPQGSLDEKQIRSAYRKIALRVHPDKQPEGADIEAFTAAFARLESAKEALEAMLAEDIESCVDIHRILRSEIHTRAGAAELLGVDKTAMLDTTRIIDEADKAGKALIKRLDKMQRVAPDYEHAVRICNEAVETLRRGCAPEALPRQEALLREGLLSSRAMGARDLRWPSPIVLMEPETASFIIPTGERARLALLCGTTATLSDTTLVKGTTRLARHPKATALRWCRDAEASSPCSSAVCVALESSRGDDPPLAKKQRVTGAGPEGTVRVRHILFRHQQLKQVDPLARRDGSARSAQEAEEIALDTLEKLLQEPNQFLKLCRSLSDCQSAAQPGMIAGDLGWLGRGQQEQSFEDAVFALGVNDFGDIVTTTRGIHIIQRLA